MKLRKSVLLEALKVLGKVVSQTSPVEVQRSVRFLGVGEQVWLTATDGVESVTVEVIGDAGDMEDFAVEYKALRELIRSTRGGEVEVTGKRLDWPEMEAVPDDAVTVELPPNFGKLLALAAPVVNLREARLALRGINLSRDGVTATNGKELLNLPCPLKIPEDMTLPFPLALLTARLVGAGTLHLWRCRNERLFRIVIGGFQWQGKALPGNFPDWKQVIPADKTLDYQISESGSRQSAVSRDRAERGSGRRRRDSEQLPEYGTAIGGNGDRRSTPRGTGAQQVCSAADASAGLHEVSGTFGRQDTGHCRGWQRPVSCDADSHITQTSTRKGDKQNGKHRKQSGVCPGADGRPEP